MQVPLLIENTAGGDNAMARRLERIDQLWDAVGQAKGGDTVGFCLDTCHAHAGGEELVGLVDRVKAITGRIDLVHANDSRDPFDSGADRHANFGEGRSATGRWRRWCGPRECRSSWRPPAVATDRRPTSPGSRRTSVTANQAEGHREDDDVEHHVQHGQRDADDEADLGQLVLHSGAAWTG